MLSDISWSDGLSRRLTTSRTLRVDRDTLWNRYVDSDSPDIFENIIVAKDGGFDEIPKLWSRLRIVQATIVLFYLFSNSYTLVSTGVDQISAAATRQRQNFLLSQNLLNIFDYAYSKGTGYGGPAVNGQDLICFTELLALAVLWITFLWQLTISSFEVGCKKWVALQAALWETLPELCSFSAMRALHFVTPAIVTSDATQLMAALKEVESSWSKVAAWVWFVTSRILILIFGLDALVLKCRENEAFFEGSVSLYKLWMLAIFVKQILGIVQLGMFVRERLFIFVFGGEDSQMQAREIARKEVWNALLSMKIYKTFGLCKSLAIMLSFDAADFQKLVLNEKARKEETSAEFYEKAVYSDDLSGSASSTDEGGCLA